MHLVREFACAAVALSRSPAPVLVRFGGGRATASKAPPEAGRRGGESIARQMWCQHLIVYACEPPDGAAASLACDGVN